MNSSPALTRVARNKPRPAQVSTNQRPTATPPAVTEASGVENVPNSSNVDVEGQNILFIFAVLSITRNHLVIDFFFCVCLFITDAGHSIYVRNLPFDTTPTQLEEVFKSFGAIKHEGIQIRSNKVCYIVISKTACLLLVSLQLCL